MMKSKWPRINWNKANAELANRPFRDLFKEPKMDIDLSQFTDLELALLQSTARDAGDAELVRDILVELGRRERARSEAETESA